MNRRTWHTAFALLLGTLSFCVQASTASELAQLEEVRRAAIKAKDIATLSRIYSPAFVGIAANGQRLTRSALFDVFSGTDPSMVFETRDVEVLDYGDTAVFIGSLIGLTAAGERVFATRFSHTFVKIDGEWVCVAGQSTRLTEAPQE
jgi:ketosteroid isomerase-like protein